uniref:Uncharacterized protein n=1 Tax=Hirondellea gigas TaxID=1518452 RepID=A0A6A7GCA9_9CRUS
MHHSHKQGSFMYPNLTSISIDNYNDIKRYTLRQEGGYDILKIYFKKENGAHQLFSKSVKFKFPRQNKKIPSDSHKNTFQNISEINTNLRNIIKELDTVTHEIKTKSEIKLELINEIQHLGVVFNAKIQEIEEKIKRL